jgi:hypothetical protein
MTALAATFSVNGDEAGGQDGTAGLKLLEPGLELAVDESGMGWDFVGSGAFHVGKVLLLIR